MKLCIFLTAPLLALLLFCTQKAISQPDNKQWDILFLNEQGQPLKGAKLVTATQEEVFASQAGIITYKKHWAANVTAKAANYYPKKINLQGYPFGAVTIKMVPLPAETKPINVYVKDKQNKPISGASVLVNPGQSAITDANGYARAMHRQIIGEYVTISVSANGYKNQRQSLMTGDAQRIEGSIRVPAETAYFTMEKGENESNVFTIVVEVLDDESNKPVNGAHVKLVLSDGATYEGSTNGKGEAKLTDMEYGYQGTTGRVIVNVTGYQEKWSDIPTELMTAKDRSDRQFLVYIKKDGDGDFDISKLAGTWESDWGPITLNVSKNSVTGSWKQSAEATGMITGGKVDAKTKTLTFTYSQSWNKKTGKVSLAFSESASGYSLSGPWRHDDGSGGGTWNMKRKK